MKFVLNTYNVTVLKTKLTTSVFPTGSFMHA